VKNQVDNAPVVLKENPKIRRPAMKISTRFGAIMVIAGLLLALNPVFARAAGTHLGVNASQIITLVCSPAEAPPTDQFTFKRLLPQGTIEPNEYVVPKGRVLIITDIICTYPSQSGAYLLTDLNVIPFYYLGNEVLRDHLTGGFVVPSEKSLKLGLPTSINLIQLRIVGYLAPNK
jgi:hypothetical protein